MGRFFLEVQMQLSMRTQSVWIHGGSPHNDQLAMLDTADIKTFLELYCSPNLTTSHGGFCTGGRLTLSSSF